jgi:hypothetical protein
VTVTVFGIILTPPSNAKAGRQWRNPIVFFWHKEIKELTINKGKRTPLRSLKCSIDNAWNFTQEPVPRTDCQTKKIIDVRVDAHCKLWPWLSPIGPRLKKLYINPNNHILDIMPCCGANRNFRNQTGCASKMRLEM